jgi:hypothetical protein
MAQPDHHIIRVFFEWVKEARHYAIFDPSGRERRAFIPIQKVQEHFEDERRQRLIEILEAVFSPGTPPLYAENVLPKYIAVFCILLHIGKGRHIPEFIKHGSLSDAALPFDPESAPPRFPHSAEDPNFFSKFCDEQWRWCAPKFQRHMLDEEFEAKRVLPITFMEELGDGGSAKLYKIKIHKLYNDLLSDDSKVVRQSMHANITRKCANGSPKIGIERGISQYLCPKEIQDRRRQEIL